MLSGCCGGFHLAAQVAQRYVHEDISAGSIEAEHQGFGVFTAFAALLGSVLGGRMNTKVKSLVVERGDGVANDLVGQLTDRLPDQIFAGVGSFDSGETAGELHGGSLVGIENDPAFDFAREANLGSDAFAP